MGKKRIQVTDGRTQTRERAEKKRTITASLFIFLGIPATILLGSWMGEKHYLLVSMAVLLETIIPFFLVYESRRPKAREIVMIALLSALTTMGNLLSFAAVPLQAGTALVIISGISFGPEAGFLVGALARFVSNFFQGQGAWTPWQMFCWGVLGFLAGLVFHKANQDHVRSRDFKMVAGPLISVMCFEVLAYLSYLVFPAGETTFLGWRLYVFGAAGLVFGVLIQKTQFPADQITLAVYTFFSVFIIYGGIINISALVTGAAFTGEISWDQLRMLYVTGVPFDLLHALKATVFMVLFGPLLLQKLERVKIKYGFYRM